MKKLILMAIVALFCATPALQAQKVNKEAIISKLEDSNDDITNPKRNSRAKTWLDRGNDYLDAALEPTKSIFINMDLSMVKLAVGNPKSTTDATINNVAYKVLIYPYFDVYFKDDKVAAWKQTKFVQKGAIDVAIEAYNKAYEVDPKSADKVKEGLKRISDFESQVGDISRELGEYKTAADAYAKAYKAQDNPAYGKANVLLLYLAGFSSTVDGEKNKESFAAGEKYFTKALEGGYTDEEGSIYYYLFHCYYGQREDDKANIIKAKDILLVGVEKAPKNESILEALIQLYTSEDSVGDPADLILLIDNAIAGDPENMDLWFSRGRIFSALKNYDESINSFKKVVEIAPDEFDGNYYLGVFYVVKGDAMNNEFNQKQITSQAEYDKGLKEILEVYKMSIPWYEKAHIIKPEDANTLENLKSICFRLRDEEGMMDLYNKYNTMWKAATGQ